MNNQKYYIFLFAILIGIFVESCQTETELTYDKLSNMKSFEISYPEYSIDMTRSASVEDSEKQSNSSNELNLEISESKWNAGLSPKTRTSLKENVNWEDSPRVGLYITDKDNKITDSYKNIAINPLTHEIYKAYVPKAYNSGILADEIVTETVSTIDGAGYFWDDSKWSKGGNTPTPANFYGYYPRPFDYKTDWEYTRNSVIDYKSLSSSSWNILSYDFWTEENDENLHEFDLMYSLSEKEGVDNRYGNIGKTVGTSIQMPFQHAFCLLDININKGGYAGQFQLSDLKFSSGNLSTSGTIDITTGKIEPNTESLGGSISRKVSFGDAHTKSYAMSMIVPPVDGEMYIYCKVDNAEYKCKFPDNFELKSGYKYTVNLTMQSSGEVYLQAWDGVVATVNGKTIESKSEKLDVADYGKNIEIQTKEGYELVKVLKNGDILKPNESGKYQIDDEAIGKVNYIIIARPKDWYSATESIRIQFDGLRNTPYVSNQDKTTTTWYDLSGKGNDGSLENFDGTQSGWLGKGLVFDGRKSIVKFPGTINDGSYTMEFYIYMEKIQNTGGTPRLIAEGIDYPAYYFRKIQNTEKWHIGLFGQEGEGKGNVHDYGKKEFIFGEVMQIDCVYDADSQKINFYYNGKKINDTALDGSFINPKSIPVASLGRRITDFTRALTGTYYSFILYDKVLQDEEIEKNYNLNITRFGTGKSTN